MFSEVRQCSADGCFYNHDKVCTARAITIGSATPKCETWMTAEKAHSCKQNSALVGACHMGNCQHNRDYFCHAVDDIDVDMMSNSACCSTFMAK